MAFPAGHEPSQEEVEAAIPGGRFIRGLENLKDYNSPLNQEQKSERDRIQDLIMNEDRAQMESHLVNDTVLLRSMQLHMHSTLGKERTADVIMARKAKPMATYGINVVLLNLNFFKRLQTLALYKFIKDDVMKEAVVPGRIELKIQEEEADDVDLKDLMKMVSELTEEAPLIVLTDETCKEVERLDDAIAQLADSYNYYHCWSSSVFAHGTPREVTRFRPDTRRCPERITEIIDLIDIDDKDVDAAEPRHVAVRQVNRTKRRRADEGLNIRKHLDIQPVKLISHINHESADVWDCEECGDLLAEYLKDVIGLGKPDLQLNDVFIVGSIERFESYITCRKFLSALIEKGIAVEVGFGRRIIRIQEKIKTMKNIVLSDNISMRGVDKRIVVIVPSHGKVAHEQKIKEQFRPPEREEKEESDSSMVADPREKAQGQDTDVQNEQRNEDRNENDVEMASDNISPDEDADDEEEEEGENEPITEADLHYSPAARQSLVRRAINRYNRADKDLILDMLKDAPEHAVLFHFANERLID